jgi:hypothetical protein
MRRYAVFLVAALGLGCAPRSVRPPPPSPVLTRGADALPADVDLVVRFDLRRMQSALGADLVSDLRRATELASGQAGSEALVLGLIEQTDVLYVGLRPRLANALDHVLVLEGNFPRFDPTTLHAEPGWQRAVNLGGDVRRWDRRAQPSRGAAARIYAWSDRVIVVASPVEIDSTERTIELGQREGALAPPSKGVISFAARVLPLALALRERSPQFARLLESAERLEGSAEIEAEGVRLDLALEVDSPETAGRMRELLASLADLFAVKGSAAAVARAAKVDVAGSYVTCRIGLPRSTIAGWLRCADSAEPCSW